MAAGVPGVTCLYRTASEFAKWLEGLWPTRVDGVGGLIKTIEAATAGDKAKDVLYASTVAGQKNTLKRAQGELEGLRRSDAVRVRAADEAAMLAWLAKQPDAAALQADIRAMQLQLDAAQAMRERDFLLPFLRPGLLGSAITLNRLALERGKPDAQRESGFQLRDEVLIEGGLKQLQRRYDPEVEKATLRYALKRYYALPAAQRIAEFDAPFRPRETRARPPPTKL